MSKWGACTFLCALTGAAPPELGGFLSLSALKVRVNIEEGG